MGDVTGAGRGTNAGSVVEKVMQIVKRTKNPSTELGHLARRLVHIPGAGQGDGRAGPQRQRHDAARQAAAAGIPRQALLLRTWCVVHLPWLSTMHGGSGLTPRDKLRLLTHSGIFRED